MPSFAIQGLPQLWRAPGLLQLSSSVWCLKFGLFSIGDSMWFLLTNFFVHVFRDVFCKVDTHILIPWKRCQRWSKCFVVVGCWSSRQSEIFTLEFSSFTRCYPRCVGSTTTAECDNQGLCVWLWKLSVSSWMLESWWFSKHFVWTVFREWC